MNKKNVVIVFGILSFILLSGSVLAAGSCLTDYDSDGLADCSDNCKFVYNPLQIDSDLDGKGDCCDPDHAGVPGYCNTPIACGDGFCSSGESYLTCPSDCPTSIICGNALLESPEECDDGNMLDNDGCSSSCLIESSGTSFSTLIISSDRGERDWICEPNWRCSLAGDCENGISKRDCVDTNFCDLNYNKPIETVPCEITMPSLVGNNIKGAFGNWSSGVWIAIFLVLILIVLWIIGRI